MDLEFCEKCGYQKSVEDSYSPLCSDCQDEEDKEWQRMIYFVIVIAASSLAYNYGWMRGYEDQKKLDENLPFQE